MFFRFIASPSVSCNNKCAHPRFTSLVNRKISATLNNHKEWAVSHIFFFERHRAKNGDQCRRQSLHDILMLQRMIVCMHAHVDDSTVCNFAFAIKQSLDSKDNIDV